MAAPLPRMYGEFAPWFHLITAPEDYADEAALYAGLIREQSAGEPRTLLELGSGGGNNASHLKREFTCTLTDLSPGMLEISRALNPECEHIAGDMRMLRLGRTFDVVFVHDAVMYLATIEDLRAAIQTAWEHTRPGGVALFVPDCVRETFAPSTDHGGEDGAGRSLRYLEWTYDPDPSDNTYEVDYAYILHEDDRPVRVEYDHHVEGLFSRAEWLQLLAETGFQATWRAVEGEPQVAFIGCRAA